MGCLLAKADNILTTAAKGIAEIILAKNRNGPVDDVRLRFREEKAQFLDIDDFDLENIPDTLEGSQSIILGSKMNNDRTGRRRTGFETDTDIIDEPPFI